LRQSMIRMTSHWSSWQSFSGWSTARCLHRARSGAFTTVTR
jgi:hypothetical protein